MVNVNQNVKIAKYMKIPLNGNVNHAILVVPNVLAKILIAVPNVPELSTIIMENVFPHAQMDITKIKTPTLVTLVMMDV